MIRVVLSLFLLFLVAASMQSQDILYTISGDKILSKVTEVNPTDIKYKDFSNLEGPVYVISKTDVVLIRFSDGSTQIINADAPAFSPKSKEKAVTAPEKKPLNLYYLNKNMISINAMALANGDVTLLYDKEFFESKLCLTLLGGYNFNSNMGILNLPVVDSWPNSKKKYDAGLGINFMPRNTRRVQYFVGLMAKYMTYDYEQAVFVNGQSVISRHDGAQLSFMVTNGWLFRVTPQLNFKFFGSVGASYYNPVLADELSHYLPKVYLGYCFGYRF